MNVNYPHDLIDEMDLRKLPAREQKYYRPVPVSKVAHLQDMTPDERATWLAENLPNEADRARVLRAIAKRERKANT